MNTLKKRPSILRIFLLATMVLVLTAAFGCGKKSNSEKVGEKVDDAVHEAGNGPKDLFDKDGKAENAGEKVDEALGGDK